MMHRRTRLVAPIAALALICSVCPATAAPKKAKAASKADAAPDRLAQHRELANQAYVAQDYARALELFRQIEAIEPSVESKIGIAYSLHGLGQYDQAYGAYEALLRDQATILAPSDHERIQQALAALRATTAALSIQSAQSGAVVTIDGVDQGATPITRTFRRAPGLVRIQVTRPGFVPFVQTLELRAGEERQVTATLEPEQLTASISVRTAGNVPAVLYIDGKEAGPLPYLGQLPPGQHQLVAVSASGRSEPRFLNALARGAFDIELAVVETPATLRVRANDSAARILIDGQALGTGSYEGSLAAGKHVITVDRDGFNPKVTTVTLSAGERYSLDNVSLESKSKTSADSLPEDFKGLYVQLTLDALVGRSGHTLATDCPATVSGGSCSSWPSGAGQLDLRLGHSFGLLGAEGFLLVGSSATQAKLHLTTDSLPTDSEYYGLARTERYLIANPWIALGVAGRVSSQSQSFRLTSGWGVGLAYQMAMITRTLEPLDQGSASTTIRADASASTHYSDGKLMPILLWDADVEFGSTPGLKLLLGLECQLTIGEAPEEDMGDTNFGYSSTGEHLSAGGGNLRAWGKTSFFLGPRLGLAFGH